MYTKYYLHRLRGLSKKINQLFFYLNLFDSIIRVQSKQVLNCKYTCDVSFTSKVRSNTPVYCILFYLYGVYEHYLSFYMHQKL